MVVAVFLVGLDGGELIGVVGVIEVDLGGDEVSDIVAVVIGAVQVFEELDHTGVGGGATEQGGGGDEGWIQLHGTDSFTDDSGQWWVAGSYRGPVSRF